MTYILYTYQTVSGQEICHAYGPSDDKAALQQIGESMAQTPGVGFMVLQLEAVPV